MPTSYELFFKLSLDFFNLLGYIIAMEDNDIQTTKLLDMVCEGVNTPTDQEENETLELQEDNFESVQFMKTYHYNILTGVAVAWILLQYLDRLRVW